MTTYQQTSIETDNQQNPLAVQSQQAKLTALQSDLEKLNTKISRHEKLSPEDTKFISNLGWLSALSVSVAAMVSGM